MNVKLYSRPRSNGMSSLYLKYYPAIFNNATGEMMQYEYLGLNVYTSPANNDQRAFNKQAMELAEKVNCKRTLECFQGSFGIGKGDGNFLVYFYKNSQNRNGKYNAVYHYLKMFTEGRCSFKDLSVSFCDRFRDYMTKQECIHYNKTLEHNSVAGYYTAFLHILQLAYKDRLIQENIASEANKIGFMGKQSKGRIFPNLNYSRLRRQMKMILNEAGITRKITFHDTRHTFAMNLNHEHVPVQKIQKLLCHKNISTTMIYVKMSTEEVRDAVNSL